MEKKELRLTVASQQDRQTHAFPVRRLICAGWVGRDRQALQAHIDELAAHGVPAPSRTPIFMNFACYLATTATAIDVVSGETSGEVEYVILKAADRLWVGVGSDQTDRGLEKYSIPGAKQMYPKVLAPVVWPYAELKGHWERIVLRSWSVVGGKRTLYQEDTLATVMDAESLLTSIPPETELPADGWVVFSGTIATKIGLEFGERFEFEMEDPVLKRSLRHGYDVRILPQYL